MRKILLRSWRSVANAVVLFAAANACSSEGVGADNDTTVAGLRFTVQPVGAATAGTTFSVAVELLNSTGQKIGNADDVVTLSIPGGGDLLGSLSQAAVSGVATFTGLSVTRAGTGFSITATANGISGSSSSFTVAPGAAHPGQSGATYTPSSIVTGATIAVVFTFKDQYGNPIPDKTVTLNSSLAGVTFTPSSGTTTATGTFTTNMVATAAGSATVSATVGGLAVSLPAAVTITAPQNFSITTSANPTTGGTTSGGGTFVQGTSVTVVATPASGFLFANWTDGATVASSSVSFTFSATANRTLVANFTPINSGNCTPVAMTFPGSNPGSVASTTCFSNGQAAQFLSFTSVPAGAHSLTVNSSFSGVNLSVFPSSLQSGVEIGSVTASPTTVTGEWMLGPGTFTVRVAANSASSGTFTLLGASTPTNNTACGFRFLAGSVTLAQNVSATDCAYGDGTFFDPFVIASSQTCTFTLSSTVFKVWLEIFNADLTTSLDFQAGTSNPSVATPSTASRTGPCNNGGAPIIVIANNFDVGSVGAYTLTVVATGGGPPAFMTTGSAPTQSLAPDARKASTWVPSTMGKKPTRR